MPQTSSVQVRPVKSVAGKENAEEAALGYSQLTPKSLRRGPCGWPFPAGDLCWSFKVTGSVLVRRPDTSRCPDTWGQGMAGMDMWGGAGLACSKFLKLTTRGGRGWGEPKGGAP